MKLVFLSADFGSTGSLGHQRSGGVVYYQKKVLRGYLVSMLTSGITSVTFRRHYVKTITSHSVSNFSDDSLFNVINSTICES